MLANRPLFAESKGCSLKVMKQLCRADQSHRKPASQRFTLALYLMKYVLAPPYTPFNAPSPVALHDMNGCLFNNMQVVGHCTYLAPSTKAATFSTLTACSVKPFPLIAPTLFIIIHCMQE